MTEPLWTPEDVELVARAFHAAECGCRPFECDDDDYYPTLARAVLAALAEAGRLREPDGGEWQWSWCCPRGDEKAPCRHSAGDEEYARGQAEAFGGTAERRRVGPWVPGDTPQDQHAAEKP